MIDGHEYDRLYEAMILSAAFESEYHKFRRGEIHVH